MTALTALTHPTVHLNGTSRTALTEGYVNAMTAVEAAISAMSMTYPNGRDYYLQGQRAIQLAMDQHAARLAAVAQVRAELEELAFAAQEGGAS
jgi:hypothetical protein